MVGLEEENVKVTEQQSMKDPSSRRKKWMVIIVALTLVGVIGFASMLLVDWLNDDEGSYEFHSDEYVNYSITGEFADDSPINGSFHILPYNITYIWGTGVLPEFHDGSGGPTQRLIVKPILAKEYEYDYIFIANEKISTPFGEKAVRTIIGPCGNSTVIINAGLQSSLVYRIIVVNEAYHYKIFMNETDSPGIWDCDGMYWEKHAEALNVVKADAMGIGVAPQSGMKTWGLIEVGPAQSLKYRIEGMNGTMYLLSMSDVHEIENSGMFHYNPTLSMILANGTVDVPTVEGLYYFFFFIERSEESDNEYGLLNMYWGPREN